ncbi:hypothetical protein [Acidithiobacillus thiooxidans]|uniref:hypothetical protein n=1 Tax=Acidithiobacillus thiooxidans TaxID=930 RepID=UPI001111F6F4|nr:hypothetical protein [Acidithiobacillus thiooxidans]
MRPDKVIVLLNSEPWLLDFKRNRFTRVPRGVHRLVKTLSSLFGQFDTTRSFRLWHHAIRYLDYNSDAEKILIEDARANREKHQVEQQPSLQIDKYLERKAAVNFNDLSDTNTTDSTLYVCSALLHASLRRAGLRKFHYDTVQIKPVPSVGARHAIEAFVQWKGMLLYYDCARHVLVNTEENIAKQDVALRIHLVPRVGVYMWRYPYGSCLLDLYFDVGHVVGNLALAAHAQGLEPPKVEISSLKQFFLVEDAMPILQVVFANHE